MQNVPKAGDNGWDSTGLSLLSFLLQVLLLPNSARLAVFTQLGTPRVVGTMFCYHHRTGPKWEKM